MKSNEFGLTRRDEQALDVAKLYYSGMTQAEIAPMMHMGRPAISKLLNHARARGFVHVEILDPRENDQSLVNGLKEKYQLNEVRLVAPAGAGPTDLRRALGQAAAQVLRDVVVTGDCVGISWSETVAEVAHALPSLTVNDVTLVQMTGHHSLAVQNRRTRTFNQFAEAFKARWHKAEVPAIFPELADRYGAEARGKMRSNTQKAEKCRVVLYSPGACDPTSSLFASDALTEAERQALTKVAAGDICARYVDERARVCNPDLNSRTASISLPELRKVEQKIVVAGGPNKVKVLHAALTWGYASRLITDVATAQQLLTLQ